MNVGNYVLFQEENKPPLKSQNTWMVAALATSGIPLAEKGFIDSVELLPDGASKRVTTWIAANQKAEFNPIKESEQIDPQEFSRRFLSKEWCEANPDHPIAYLRFFMETYQGMRAWLHDRKPSALVRRGKRFALIPADASTAEREKLLSFL